MSDTRTVWALLPWHGFLAAVEVATVDGRDRTTRSYMTPFVPAWLAVGR
jgi:hypothetical protein